MMASASCCDSDIRPESPDAPGARHPFIDLASRQLLPRPSFAEWADSADSLTRSDICELRNYVPASEGTVLFPERDYSASTPSSSPHVGPSRSSKFLSRIKNRLSKEKLFLRIPRMKERLRKFSGSRKRETSVRYTFEDHHLAVSSDSPDLLAGYDSDAHPLTDEEVVDRLTPHSLPRPSCSQPSATYATESVDANRTSASTRLATESRTSQSDHCTQNLDPFGSQVGTKTDFTLSSSSLLGAFPFEHGHENHRGRQLSRDSDIALAAEALFDSLCSRLSSQITPELQQPRDTAESLDATNQQLQVNSKTSATILAAVDSEFQDITGTTPAFVTESERHIAEMTKSNEQAHFRSERRHSTTSVHLTEMRISQRLRSMSDQSKLSESVPASRSEQITPSPGKVSEEGTEETFGLDLSPQEDAAFQYHVSPHLTQCQSLTCALVSSFSLPHTTRQGSGEEQLPPINPGQLSGTSSMAFREAERSNLMNFHTTNAKTYSNIADDAEEAVGSHNIQSNGLRPRSGSNTFVHGTKRKVDKRRFGIIWPKGTTPNFSEFEGDSCNENQPNSPNSKDRGFDGPADPSSTLIAPKIAVVPPEEDSVGGNYEETTSVWERAMRIHDARLANVRKKRGSSLSSSTIKSTGHSRHSSEASDKGRQSILDLYTRESPSPGSPITLKRVDTSHSFDLIRTPGRATLTQPPSPDKERAQSGSMLSGHTPHGRKRSISQPPLSQLTVPGFQLHRDPAPSDNRPVDSPDAKEFPLATRSGPKKVTNLQAWSRYPSHNRAERNGSAGLADKVNVRDFGADENVLGDEGNRAASGKKSRFTTATSKIRVKLNMFRGKFLTNVPSVLKDRTSPRFRRREHGHRTSIAPGGILKNPELELGSSLPQSRAETEHRAGFQPDFDEESATYMGRRARTPDQIARRDEVSQNPRFRVTSSVYSSPRSQHDTMALSMDATNDWASVYRECVGSLSQRQDHEAKPFDEAVGKYPFSRPTSSDRQNCPPTYQGDGSTDGPGEKTLTSTQELCRMLDKEEFVELARAIRATEEAFKE